MKLFYREKGLVSNPPLILLHGLWGASDNWLPVANRLAEHFHVLLPDLRNHGQSPHEAQMDYEVMSEDVATLIETLRLPVKPIIAGHSMGGKVVLTLLLKKPSIAEKAIVIDIAPIRYSGPFVIRHIQLLDFIRSTDLSVFQKREEAITFIRHQFPEEEEHQLLLKNIRKTQAGHLEWKINAPALLEYVDALNEWHIPTGAAIGKQEVLFIKGANSNYIQDQDCVGITTLFPSARFTTIPDAGHCIHAEQPVLLAAAMNHFCLTNG